MTDLFGLVLGEEISYISGFPLVTEFDENGSDQYEQDQISRTQHTAGRNRLSRTQYRDSGTALAAFLTLLFDENPFRQPAAAHPAIAFPGFDCCVRGDVAWIEESPTRQQSDLRHNPICCRWTLCGRDFLVPPTQSVRPH